MQPLATHFPIEKDAFTVSLIASECAPFSQSGGLGQAIQGLALGLRDRGHRVSVYVPMHQGSSDIILDEGLRVTKQNTVQLKGLALNPIMYQTNFPLSEEIQIYLCDSKEGLFRNQDRHNTYSDNPSLYNYIFFSRVTSEHLAPRCLTESRSVIHTHDWHAGFMPLIFQTKHRDLRVPCVHSIHNLAYTSRLEVSETSRLLGIERGNPRTNDLREILGNANNFRDPLLSALRLSDRLVAVSETYRRETLSHLSNIQYRSVLNQRNGEGHYTGIANGIDPTWFSNLPPEEFVKAKADWKYRVQHILGLQKDKRALLIMMAARYDSQKGYELVLPVLLRLAENEDINFQFVVCANATDSYGVMVIEMLNLIKNRYPHRVAIKEIYSDELARLMYSGADLALSPSRYEPFGMVAPVGMLRGTPTIGRSTGGMEELIQDGINGFLISGQWYLVPGDSVFNNLVDQLYKKVLEVYTQFQDKEAWRSFIINMMTKANATLSWSESAKKYEAVYQESYDDRQKKCQ